MQMQSSCGYGKAFYRMTRTKCFPRLPKPKYTEEILFGMYDSMGNTSGEATIGWYPSITNQNIARLELLDDAFHLLTEFRDFLTDLASLRNKETTPDRVCQLLIKHGFADESGK